MSVIPKKHVSIHKCSPVLQAVPPYLSNSICGSSARTRRVVAPPLSQTMRTACDVVPNGGQGSIAIHCFSVTSKKRDTRQLLGKIVNEIYITTNEAASFRERKHLSTGLRQYGSISSKTDFIVF